MSSEITKQIQQYFSEFLDCKCSRYIPAELNANVEMLRGIYRKQYMINDGFIPVIVDMGHIRNICNFYFNGSEDEYLKFRSSLQSSDNSGGKDILTNLFNSKYRNGERWKNFESDKTFYDVPPQTEICNDTYSNFYGEYMVVRIPLDKPWSVFANIPFGSGNMEFNPHDTIKIARFFYEEFGAIPCYFDSVTMEFRLKNPLPFDKIYGLMPEIYSFCFDNIGQGPFENAYSYVRFLCKSPFWHFWWD